ncbi:hypothetical protein QTP70_001658 [Hemibagrus guttatus]|uniref:Reverse transcriptase domain-containing protein n=1 Tax=Hemibagrus guttatus TaxID=175788 RepID=A0AAE0R8Y3_9TELE|nr:hypothetical protein QTP70_001658 [Hemibagrus guttatus]KAK3569593.1 hypothetical protein QTP86_002166 [Hemibagrus guttatus]
MGLLLKSQRKVTAGQWQRKPPPLQVFLHLLTGRTQSVRIGNSTSSTSTLNTGAPEGCVLSPLLFTLLTQDCAAMHSSNHIIKLADDTTMVDLISKNESAYREEPHHCLVWELHRLGSQDLQRIVRTAEKIIGVFLPSIIDIYSTRCIREAITIVDDPTHPSHTLFTLLPSGKRRQFVRLGTHVSDFRHISTGSPQGCVLSPLLFSLYINGCTSGHQSVKLLKFANNTTLIGLISDGDESAYRSEMDRLV